MVRVIIIEVDLTEANMRLSTDKKWNQLSYMIFKKRVHQFTFNAVTCSNSGLNLDSGNKSDYDRN